jgi:heterotetrameric sarcosine oxidase gamma subunit
MLDLSRPGPAAVKQITRSAQQEVTVTAVRGLSLMLLTKARGTTVTAELGNALGYAPPDGARQCTRPAKGAGFCLWHAPHQWLIATDAAEGPGLVRALRGAMEGHTIGVLDFAGALEGLRIGGTGAMALLAKGSLLDFRDQAFPPGTGARTLFAEQSVFILRRDAASACELFYDWSAEPAIRAWFHAVAAPFPV